MNEAEFLERVRGLAAYWSNVEGSKESCVDGFAFSVLGLFDGVSVGTPQMIITVKETGEVVNPNPWLHELYYESN